MYNVEEVTDEYERAAAKVQLDQDGQWTGRTLRVVCSALSSCSEF